MTNKDFEKEWALFLKAVENPVDYMNGFVKETARHFYSKGHDVGKKKYPLKIIINADNFEATNYSRVT